MQKCRQADVENINILFFKHFIKIGVMAFVWIVFHSLGTDVAYCDKLGVVHAFPCRNVRSAYSANADECDFQHFIYLRLNISGVRAGLIRLYIIIYFSLFTVIFGFFSIMFDTASSGIYNCHRINFIMRRIR